MTSRVGRAGGAIVSACLVALVCASPSVRGAATFQNPSPSLTDLLARSGAYLSEYEQKFAAVVSEEEYIQSLRDPPGAFGIRPAPIQRVTRGDVLLVNLVGSQWIGFRDVFEVDGGPVHDHDQRLQKLFLESPGELLARAAAITDESARFNLGSIRRTINVPTMALVFLSRVNQTRSTFRLRGDERVNANRASVVDFNETAVPTIIRSGKENLPASGRFWIEPDSGRVLRTELIAASRGLHVTVDVTYGLNSKVEMWVPTRMSERYEVSTGETVSALAIYSNCRKFSVNALSTIKK